MKIIDAETPINALRTQAEKDSDTLLVCYFSREEDKYQGYMSNMDAGDALIVIEQLIRNFNLSPEAIAASSGLFHRREERIVTLIAALKRAKEIIMELRGMGKAGSWDAYQNSPEMKQINAALESDAVEGHSDEEAVWARLLERADRKEKDK